MKPPCLVCGRQMNQVLPDEASNQPSGGLEFTSCGGYGCTVFDPMDGTMLAINVCDLCLMTHKDRVGLYGVNTVAPGPWK